MANGGESGGTRELEGTVFQVPRTRGHPPFSARWRSPPGAPSFSARTRSLQWRRTTLPGRRAAPSHSPRARGRAPGGRKRRPDRHLAGSRDPRSSLGALSAPLSPVRVRVGHPGVIAPALFGAAYGASGREWSPRVQPDEPGCTLRLPRHVVRPSTMLRNVRPVTRSAPPIRRTSGARGVRAVVASGASTV